MRKFSKSQIKSLPIIPYDQVRTLIKSGDLIFASGNYFISKIIQRISNSPWSHIGIILKSDNLDRVLLLESVETFGVRFIPLSKYLTDYENKKPYDGQIVIARHGQVSLETVKILARTGIDRLSVPYDNLQILVILSRIILRIGKKNLDNKYICSELIYECFKEVGISFEYDKKGFIAPENIWEDKNIKLIQRIL